MHIDETLFPYRNKKMADDHLRSITEFDGVTLDRGETRWVRYKPSKSINLNDYEKIHSGGSSDSYILHSISDPNV